ncbi:uncharacterized protein LOC142607615 [Castanea sativa]|uniref:uncharacterized protein LOC142607615 n=1 Tax=Castanea sativa TaxID=21020 RepID=UPI003F6499CC
MATTNNQGDKPHTMALERQVQMLAAAVERLTKQNHDLEEQLRQRNAHLGTQEEDQDGTSAKRRNQEGLKAPSLPSLSTPGEELFLYLAVSSAAVSAALIREEDKVQRPVYFISRALRGAEERYPQMEKLAFALVTAARKLKPYFQAHTINVLIDKTLQRAMSSPETAGRMALWVVELSEFDIRYQPRAAMKGQILADFIAEFTIKKDQGTEETPVWRIHMDGSPNIHARGARVVLYTPEGDKIECMIHLDFHATNNEAKYEALITGQDLAIAAGAKSVVVYSNS